ncbi:NPCBM/NEW2 domain-containing protein [Actinosynnema sp. NPDC047251]|uniref:NPCBM/NEW2 domain-containing protein n=1 Tax=Saccharothrix espanaensis TaxID=103731 RepID=UPI0002E85166|nr:NPCBM/NEW2 domain-containing protein [Saccharothrix espanaensis]
MTPPPPVDPAIQAAHITRRGALLAAVLAALITATATGVGAYFAGRKEGVAAAQTVTVVQTVVSTATAPPSGSSDPAAPTRAANGGASLLDLNTVEEYGYFTVSLQKVDTKEYPRAVTAWLGACGKRGEQAFREYHLDRKYQRLQMKVGLSDGSKSGSSAEFRVLVDGQPVSSATTQVGLGQVRDVEVDVTNALRVRLEARFVGAGCFNDHQAGAAWIGLSLG